MARYEWHPVEEGIEVCLPTKLSFHQAQQIDKARAHEGAEGVLRFVCCFVLNVRGDFSLLDPGLDAEQSWPPLHEKGALEKRMEVLGYLDQEAVVKLIDQAAGLMGLKDEEQETLGNSQEA